MKEEHKLLLNRNLFSSFAEDNKVYSVYNKHKVSCENDKTWPDGIYSRICLRIFIYYEIPNSCKLIFLIFYIPVLLF